MLTVKVRNESNLKSASIIEKIVKKFNMHKAHYLIGRILLNWNDLLHPNGDSIIKFYRIVQNLSKKNK